jgi:hypothetical protein
MDEVLEFLLASHPLAARLSGRGKALPTYNGGY